MDEVHEYFIGPTGAVHLVRQDAVFKSPFRTRCGLSITYDGQWRGSDETLSGVQATCKRCRLFARVAP